MADPLELQDTTMEGLIISALRTGGVAFRDEVQGEHTWPAPTMDGDANTGSFALEWGKDENLDLYRGDDVMRIDQRVFVLYRHRLQPHNKRESQQKARQAAVVSSNALVVSGLLAMHGYRVSFVDRVPSLVDDGNTLEQRVQMSIIYDRGAL